MALIDRLVSTFGAIASDIKTLAGRINGFAPLDSPSFQGEVKVPTPPASDDSERAVNSSWVNTRMGSISGSGSAAGGQYLGRVDPIRPGNTATLVANIVASGSNSNYGLTAGQRIFLPFVLGRDIQISKMGVRVTTAVSGSTAALAIYASDGTASYDLPGTLLASGTVATTATGYVFATLSEPLMLKAGVLYWGAVSSSQAPVLGGSSPATIPAILGTNASGVSITHFVQSGAPVTPPNPQPADVSYVLNANAAISFNLVENL